MTISLTEVHFVAVVPGDSLHSGCDTGICRLQEAPAFGAVLLALLPSCRQVVLHLGFSQLLADVSGGLTCSKHLTCSCIRKDLKGTTLHFGKLVGKTSRMTGVLLVATNVEFTVPATVLS